MFARTLLELSLFCAQRLPLRIKISGALIQRLLAPLKRGCPLAFSIRNDLCRLFRRRAELRAEVISGLERSDLLHFCEVVLTMLGKPSVYQPGEDGTAAAAAQNLTYTHVRGCLPSCE
ncbi:hypothetical protein NB700_001905 [Xanthomonas sacchari]|uniref:Uncharacterized protein n=1 Tax=Xanthomonas sacchari TaxID=56458 RepID=A0ABT3DWN2_9XANT|nr:hypothetical protein [Xanthomonas sacchari]